MGKLSVAIVDDHDLVAETLRVALTGSGVDAYTIAPRELSQLLAELLVLQPTVVLLDLDLGSFGDATDSIAPLTLAGVRVLVVSGTPDRLRIARALERGAVGYQPKAGGFAQLLARTARALTCDKPLDPVERAVLLDELARERSATARALAPFRSLTDREQDTLVALAAGQSVRDIAEEWVVSEATVRSHVRGVLTKLGAPSQLAAVAVAFRDGWVTA